MSAFFQLHLVKGCRQNDTACGGATAATTACELCRGNDTALLIQYV